MSEANRSGELAAKEQWRFVANVRDARRLVTEADDLLYGVFGVADDAERECRMRLAATAAAKAAALLSGRCES